jgi:serine/threonine-protein kinase
VSVNTTDPMIGRLIDGRYQIRSRIARGGMATVYLATDLRLERRVAIKVMHGHLADDSQFKQRFIQEARSAARLAHPNVVNVFDQGQDSDSAYLVMEYLPGITLRDLLTEYGSLTPQQAIDIVEAVLSGLAAAHKAGIVHRDLKPENVLLADDGRIKIGDFGLARAATANTATGAALLGTIAYLSPELVTRGVADTRSDIYAVGIMMYEMLTGEQPFTGEQPMQIAYRHANEPVPPPSRRNDKVPPELDDLVLWATAKDPDHRPADARAMLEQVRDTESSIQATTGGTAAQRTIVLPAAPVVPPPAPPPVRPDADAETQILGARRGAAVAPPAAPKSAPPRPRRRRRWIPLLIILVVLLAGGGVGWWYTLGPGAPVTVPSIAGLTVDEATNQLTELGFLVAEETDTTYSPTVAVDLVAETNPAIGSSVDQGSTIQLLISIGPKPIPIAFTAGMTQSAAEEIVRASFELREPELRFDAAVPAGQLLDALAADGSSLLGVETYGEGQPITLVVSVGALPAVAGETLDAATTILADVDLAVETGQEIFDNTIPAGSVIAIEITEPDGTAIVFQPGDTVRLTISKGPDLVEIPANIEDLTLAEAKAALEALGFVVQIETNINPPELWDQPFAEVDDATPGPGELALRGSTVVLEAYV